MLLWIVREASLIPHSLQVLHPGQSCFSGCLCVMDSRCSEILSSMSHPESNDNGIVSVQSGLRELLLIV